MKQFAFFIYCLLCGSGAFAQTDTTLKVRFTFDQIPAGDTLVTDESGNNFTGKLKQNATIGFKGGKGGVLNLGTDEGYLDLGTEFGSRLIGKLNNFTISTYIYIGKDCPDGFNALFEFGNHDAAHPTAMSFMYFTTYYMQYRISSSELSPFCQVRTFNPLLKGTWKHLALTYNGSTGKLYIDGGLIASTNNMVIAPYNLGSTIYNTIGGSSYPSDVCLTKTLIDEFRIYNVALPDSSIKKLASELADYRLAIDEYLLQDLVDGITFNVGPRIKNNLPLPVNVQGTTVDWSSSDPATISTTGTVVRPGPGATEKSVVLTASVTSGNMVAAKQFNFIVIPLPSDEEAVKEDIDSLLLDSKIKCLHSDIYLPKTGVNGSSITWKSSLPNKLSDDGTLLSRPTQGNGALAVELTATITFGSAIQTKIFQVSVAENDPYSAYLFVHFKEGSEAIRFAVSDDGYHYKSLNYDNPVLSSKVISSTGGVRDPHILRCSSDRPLFYMVATDMMAANGWDSNRALVLMKSTDLINWTSTVINVATTYPSLFSDIQCAWAPQTYYDKAMDKYMVYWSMHNEAGPQKIYYAYTNSDFTAFEAAPALLFERPGGAYAIDADILEKDGLFYMFYKDEGGGTGIMKAVSSSLTGPYTEIDGFLDLTDVRVEGSCIFRMINSDTYIMLYDAYGGNFYQFTQTTDLTNFTLIDNLVTMNFAPKHGTVIPITAGEKAALVAKWNPSSPVDALPRAEGRLVSTHLYRLNGTLVDEGAGRLEPGIYIRKRCFDSGAVVVDKVMVGR